MLDLETLSADDRTHLVMRDQELDGWRNMLAQGPRLV
jgi:hypothetical protein